MWSTIKAFFGLLGLIAFAGNYWVNAEKGLAMIWWDYLPLAFTIMWVQSLIRVHQRHAKLDAIWGKYELPKR